MSQELLIAKIEKLEDALEELAADLRDQRAEIEADEIYPYAHFPKMWDFGDKPCDGHRGPVPSDAGTIYVVFAEDKPPFSFSLSYLVEDVLDSCGAYGKIVAGEHVPAARAVMEALRAAAARLESALSENETETKVQKAENE